MLQGEQWQQADFPASPGAYAFTIALSSPLLLNIPRFTGILLPAGRYVYVGSARGSGGLRARLRRHLRRSKTAHWHIDRLTVIGAVQQVIAVPHGRECALMQKLSQMPGVTVPVAGFGASDCRSCQAHMAAVPARFDLRALAPSALNWH